jgi:hypothetical protein
MVLTGIQVARGKQGNDLIVHSERFFLCSPNIQEMTSVGSYNNLIEARQRDDPVWGKLVEAAGEPQYWLVACSAVR